MGCVSSKQETVQATRCHGARLLCSPAAAEYQQTEGVATQPAAAQSAWAAAAQPAEAAVAAVPAGGFSPTDVASTPVVAAKVMQRTRAVLRGLSSIQSDGSRGSLGQAAAVLLQQLHEYGANCVIITAAAHGSPICVLAGCAGLGASSLQQQLLLTDASLSAALCSTQGEQQPYLYQTVTSPEAAEELAPDWAQLHLQHGLKSFLAMKVGEPNKSVGVMTLASLQPSAFMELWWGPLLSMLSSGLLPLLNHPLMAGMCKIAHELQRAQTLDYRAYTMLMLQHSSALLESVTGMQLVVRLGLLSRDGRWVVVQHISGLQHLQQQKRRTQTAPLALATIKQVKLPAHGTILCEAIAAQAPRLVADTSLYSQALSRPSSDVFLGGKGEASLVVVPLQLGPGVEHKAALYVLHDKPSSFASAKRPICVLASVLQLLLHKELQEGGRLTGVWQDASVQEVQDSAPPCRQDSAQGQSTGPLMSPSSAQPATASALVQMLQQQMRNNQQMSNAKLLLQAAQLRGHLEDLQVNCVLGKGGFGIVCYGTWKGCPAAIKVMDVPRQQRRVMKAAMEMAMQELSHPNIVRVFACLIDMVEEAVPGAGSSSNASGMWASRAYSLSPASLRFRPATPMDVEAGAICNVMVMEYCEGGTLAAALRAGLIHETDNINGRTVVSIIMWKLLTVLLDVARSLEYVHKLSVLHCDLKPANVLLKSSPDSPLGLVAKLADFGLAKIMNDRMYIHNKSVSGTITHLAPERFEPGSRLTPAVDIYAFGMLMYEAYTRRAPYPMLHPATILQAVVHGQRPEFPQGTPPAYQALAEACWAQEAAVRPSAELVVQQLQEMLALTNGPSVFDRHRHVQLQQQHQQQLLPHAVQERRQ